MYTQMYLISSGSIDTDEKANVSFVMDILGVLMSLLASLPLTGE